VQGGKRIGIADLFAIVVNDKTTYDLTMVRATKPGATVCVVLLDSVESANRDELHLATER
jgi:hypothetical protein